MISTKKKILEGNAKELDEVKKMLCNLGATGKIIK